MRTFLIGLRSYREAWNLIFQQKLDKYFVVPVLLYFLYFSVAGFALVNIHETTKNILSDFLYHQDIKGWMWLLSIFTSAIVFIIQFLFFLVFTYISGYIILILMSPVLSIVSEKTEEIITGNKYPFSLSKILKDTKRGIKLAFINLVSQIGVLILVFMLSFIPLIGFFVPLIFFIISAYFYGFSFIDYYLERKNLSPKQSVKIIRKNKGLAIANGIVFSLFLFIPYINFLLAGFASILSVVAGTIAMNKIWKDKM